MYKLGSHNSWSFGKTKWYIPRFICRCQKLDIQHQYMYGVRLFDLRLRLNKKGIWEAAHGLASFKVDYSKDLQFLNDRKNCYVRVLLEYNSKPKNIESIEELFKSKCQFLELEYPNIKFFGGNHKWDSERVYEFKNPDEPLLDRYSSTTSWFKSNSYFLRIIDDWWPWLYAKFHNRKNYREFFKQQLDSSWLFIDFIEIG